MKLETVAPTHHRDTRIARLLLAVLSLVSASIIVGTFCKAQIKISFRDENRNFAELPVLSWESLQTAKYFAALDRFLGDRFSLRPLFIKTHELFEDFIFRTAPKGMVRGSNGMLFHRFIVDRYTRNSAKYFPQLEWRQALWRLHDLCKATGKILVLETFRNAPYIYPEVLPRVWRERLNDQQAPLEIISQEAAQRGVVVLDYTAQMRQFKESGLELYSPLGENHPSPLFFFTVYREQIAALAKAVGKAVHPAESFPSTTSSDIKLGNYLDYFRTRPQFSTSVPWTRQTETPSASTGGLDRLYEYTGPESSERDGNHRESNDRIPATVAYSDSFINALMLSVGPLYLPHFERFTLHYGDTGAEGLADARIVLITFSDQTTAGWALVDTAANHIEALLKSGKIPAVH